MPRQKKRTGRPTIGFQISNLWDNYTNSIWPGVAETCREKDVNLLIYNGGILFSKESSTYKYWRLEDRVQRDFEYQSNILYECMNPREIDALIMTTGTLCLDADKELFQNSYSHFKKISFPLVSIAIHLKGIPSILVDNRKGIRDIVNHMIEHHGKRHIAFIRGPEINDEAEERYQAYLEALVSHGIEVDPRLAVNGFFDVNAGIEAVIELLDHRKVKFDAVVAANDNMAMGAMKILTARGFKIPQDIAVAGFDDNMEGRFTSIPLTTVKQPFHQQAVKAAELAIDMINGIEVPEKIVLPTQMILRASCGCSYESLVVNDQNSAVNFKCDSTESLRTDLGPKLLNEILRDIINIAAETYPEFIIRTGDFSEFIRLYYETVAGNRTSNEMLIRITEILNDYLNNGVDFHPFNYVFTQIKTRIQSLFHSPDEIQLLNNLYQDILLIIADKMHIYQGLQFIKYTYNNNQLISVSQGLISKLGIEDMLNALVKILPRLNVPACYLYLYPEKWKHNIDDDWNIPKNTELVFAWNSIDGRIDLTNIKRLFTSKRLIHPVIQRNRSSTLIANALYNGEDHLGTVLFELGNFEGIIYDLLKIEISTALKGSNLLSTAQKAEEQLEKMNETLQAANGKLVELDKAKTNFFTNISHELRTPLTLMFGPLEAIRNGVYGNKLEEIQPVLGSILNNGNRLAKLINTLLDFSKIEAGKMVLKKTTVDMKKLLNIIVDSIQPGAESRGLKVTFTDNVEYCWASIDTDLFEKAILNLISNALKFTPAGGSISIDFNKTNDCFYITVADTGIGIPKDKLDFIFDRFSQLDNTVSRKYEGTGIGLAFAKEIVKLHGGNISVNSTLGKGSKFTITLPFVDEIPDGLSENVEDIQEIKAFLLSDLQLKKDDGGSSRQDYSEQTSRKKILIVDDNLDMRNFLKSVLGNEYRTAAAENGEAALKSIRNDRPDIVISDVMMPGMNGYELTQALKSDPYLKSIPIILLTARVDISSKIEGLEYKANDYLPKPFNTRELSVRIHNLLESKALEEELTKKQQEINQDFIQAALVQRSILTSESVYQSIENFNIDIRYIPMNSHISGDYYNIIKTNDTSFSILLADASGHGIQAALSTMQMDITNKETLDIQFPDVRLEKINDIFIQNRANQNFFTAFIINVMPGHIYYSSAAHPNQYLIKAKNKNIVPLKTKGKVIGMLPDQSFEMKSHQIEKGDLIFLFTDGILEEFNSKWEEFGQERLVDFLKNETAGLSPKAINDKLLSQLAEYTGDKNNSDDITLITIRVN